MEQMNDLEQRVVAAIAGSRAELVELASDLIRFDTTARDARDPARDEAALQAHLAGRLRAAGAEVEVWEPRPEDVRGFASHGARQLSLDLPIRVHAVGS